MHLANRKGKRVMYKMYARAPSAPAEVERGQIEMTITKTPTGAFLTAGYATIKKAIEQVPANFTDDHFNVPFQPSRVDEPYAIQVLRTYENANGSTLALVYVPPATAEAAKGEWDLGGRSMLVRLLKYPTEGSPADLWNGSLRVPLADKTLLAPQSVASLLALDPIQDVQWQDVPGHDGWMATPIQAANGDTYLLVNPNARELVQLQRGGSIAELAKVANAAITDAATAAIVEEAKALPAPDTAEAPSLQDTVSAEVAALEKRLADGEEEEEQEQEQGEEEEEEEEEDENEVLEDEGQEQEKDEFFKLEARFPLGKKKKKKKQAKVQESSSEADSNSLFLSPRPKEQNDYVPEDWAQSYEESQSQFPDDAAESDLKSSQLQSSISIADDDSTVVDSMNATSAVDSSVLERDIDAEVAEELAKLPNAEEGAEDPAERVAEEKLMQSEADALEVVPDEFQIDEDYVPEGGWENDEDFEESAPTYFMDEDSDDEQMDERDIVTYDGETLDEIPDEDITDLFGAFESGFTLDAKGGFFKKLKRKAGSLAKKAKAKAKKAKAAIQKKAAAAKKKALALKKKAVAKAKVLKTKAVAKAKAAKKTVVEKAKKAKEFAKKKAAAAKKKGLALKTKVAAKAKKLKTKVKTGVSRVSRKAKLAAAKASKLASKGKAQLKKAGAKLSAAKDKAIATARKVKGKLTGSGSGSSSEDEAYPAIGGTSDPELDAAVDEVVDSDARAEVPTSSIASEQPAPEPVVEEEEDFAQPDPEPEPVVEEKEEIVPSEPGPVVEREAEVEAEVAQPEPVAEEEEEEVIVQPEPEAIVEEEATQLEPEPEPVAAAVEPVSESPMEEELVVDEPVSESPMAVEEEEESIEVAEPVSESSVDAQESLPVEDIPESPLEDDVLLMETTAQDDGLEDDVYEYVEEEEEELGELPTEIRARSIRAIRDETMAIIDRKLLDNAKNTQLQTALLKVRDKRIAIANGNLTQLGVSLSAHMSFLPSTTSYHPSFEMEALEAKSPIDEEWEVISEHKMLVLGGDARNNSGAVIAGRRGIRDLSAKTTDMMLEVSMNGITGDQTYAPRGDVRLPFFPVRNYDPVAVLHCHTAGGDFVQRFDFKEDNTAVFERQLLHRTYAKGTYGKVLAITYKDAVTGLPATLMVHLQTNGEGWQNANKKWHTWHIMPTNGSQGVHLAFMRDPLFGNDYRLMHIVVISNQSFLRKYVRYNLATKPLERMLVALVNDAGPAMELNRVIKKTKVAVALLEERATQSELAVLYAFVTGLLRYFTARDEGAIVDEIEMLESIPDIVPSREVDFSTLSSKDRTEYILELARTLLVARETLEVSQSMTPALFETVYTEVSERIPRELMRNAGAVMLILRAVLAAQFPVDSGIHRVEESQEESVLKLLYHIK